MSDPGGCVRGCQILPLKIFSSKVETYTWMETQREPLCSRGSVCDRVRSLFQSQLHTAVGLRVLRPGANSAARILVSLELTSRHN